MIGSLQNLSVYLVTGHTDMRKAMNGLSLMISEQLGHDPFDGSLFVFCNKGRDKLKILHWQHNGFWLYYRRLDKGKFRWPQSSETDCMILSYRELSWLLDGLSLVQSQSHPQVLGLVNN